MANGIRWEELYSDMDKRELEESKADLMYMFFDETDMEAEEVYSIVYMEGRKISWQ